jgi:hypothetical protein
MAGVESFNRNVARVLAGVVGGGALVTMGVLATATGGQAPTAVPPSAMGPMTGAVTVTEVAPVPTAATSALAISKAVPAVKASAYK